MKINKICLLTKVTIINKKDEKPWINITLNKCKRKKDKLFYN